MNVKRVLSGIAALMMCAAVMTGCGNDSSSTAENSPAASESEAVKVEDSTDAVTETTGSTTEAAQMVTTEATKAKEDSVFGDSAGIVKVDENAPDVQEARKLAVEYLDALQAADADKLIEIMNFSEMIEKVKELAEASGQEVDSSMDNYEDEIRESFKDMEGMIKSYELLGVYEVPEISEAIDENISEMEEEMEDARENASEEEIAQMEQAMALMREMFSFDKLYVFDADIVTDDGREESPVVVVHDKNGWRVDGVLMPAMIGYVKKSKITSANVAAKSMNNAVLSAIVDMDTEDIDIRLLDGEYEWKGSDFENLKRPATVRSQEEALTSMMQRVTEYYSDVTKLEAIKISIKDGTVSGIAVQYGNYTTIREGERPCFGCYPHMFSESESAEILTLDDAFRYAQE